MTSPTMDFMDIEGALQWDGNTTSSNEMQALHIPAMTQKTKLSKKQRKRKRTLDDQSSGTKQESKKPPDEIVDINHLVHRHNERLQVNVNVQTVRIKSSKEDCLTKAAQSQNEWKISPEVMVDEEQAPSMKKRRKRKPRNNKFEGWTKSKPVTENDILSNSNKCTGDPSLRKSKPEGDNNQSLGKDVVRKRMIKRKQPEQSNILSRGRQKQGSDLKFNSTEKTSKDGEINQSKILTTDRRKERSGLKLNLTNKMSDSMDLHVSDSSDNDYQSECSDVGTSKENKDVDIIYVGGKQTSKQWRSVNVSWSHQLKSARFRFINETLYNQSGQEAFQQFKGDRKAFQVYHEGYNQQVGQWPENPVDVMISFLNKRSQALVVGDFGCGEAKIAKSVKQKVFSYDIFPANDRVTVCNISRVPLKAGSLDIAIYCLSLMGNNWTDYIREAYRVLKLGGQLKIAEVSSRFSSIDSFANVLKKLGFKLNRKDLTNKMFYIFDFKKTETSKSTDPSLNAILKPCTYKKR